MRVIDSVARAYRIRAFRSGLLKKGPREARDHRFRKQYDPKDALASDSTQRKFFS
jgi:hypothetical protein